MPAFWEEICLRVRGEETRQNESPRAPSLFVQGFWLIEQISFRSPGLA
jgi:hypothetical protein